jgi:hypothetical protein
MHIAFLNNEQLLRTLNVLVKKELGSERLFLHYIYLKIERNVLKFSVEQYCRCVRILADKGYSNDNTFWHEHMFKYVSEVAKPKGVAREFTADEAKEVWDSLIYLKFKCPDVDLKDTLKKVEIFMPTA